MCYGAKSSTERSRDLRARRREMGLKELRVWITKEDEPIAKKIMKTFEQVALVKNIQERNEDKEESIKYAIEEFRRYTNSRNIPRDKEFSSQKQRLFAYRIARAARISLPNDLIFTDKHLLKGWIDSSLKRFNKTQQVESYIQMLKRNGLE
jgi:hypothetical protein